VVGFRCPGSFTREGEGVSHSSIRETAAGEGAHQDWGGGSIGHRWQGKLQMWATPCGSVDATTSRSTVERAHTCLATRWRTGGSRAGYRRRALRVAPMATTECARRERKRSMTRRGRALIEEMLGRGSRCWRKRHRAAVVGGSGTIMCGDGTLQRCTTGEQGTDRCAGPL
jgi:hypothetical protein